MREISDVSQEEQTQFSTLFSEGYSAAQNQNRRQVGILLPTYCEAGNIENLIREIGSLNIEPLIVNKYDCLIVQIVKMFSSELEKNVMDDIKTIIAYSY